MKLAHITILIGFLLSISCKQVDMKQKQKSFIAEKEVQKIGYENAKKTALFEPHKYVKKNLILCDNFKFTIKVDRLADSTLRYICWKKPKPTMAEPDLILKNGFALENNAQDRWEYFFSHDEWNYSIEKIVSGDAQDIIHIFLEIENEGFNQLKVH